jgi:hypothetical protein
MRKSPKLEALRHSIAKYLGEHGPCSREQLSQSLAQDPALLTNVLQTMRLSGALECEFKGRFSRWQVPSDRRKHNFAGLHSWLGAAAPSESPMPAATQVSGAGAAQP